MSTWNYHNIKPIRCVLRPRLSYKNKPVKEQILKNSGEFFDLIPLWKMGPKDPYPGEWALGTHDYTLLDKLGITWIASGDVKIIN